MTREKSKTIPEAARGFALASPRWQLSRSNFLWYFQGATGTKDKAAFSLESIPSGSGSNPRARGSLHMSAFMDFLTGEWYFAFPMLFMSLAAVTLVIWRALLNHNSRTDMNVFLPQFQKALEKDGVDGALRFCRSQTGVIPRKLFVAGL